MQTGRGRALRAMEFRIPDRIPLCLEIDPNLEEDRILGEKLHELERGDFIQAMNTDPDFTPSREGEDEWGNVWSTMGETMGEVTEPSLAEWKGFDAWKRTVPDYRDPKRYQEAKRQRDDNPDRHVMGGLGALMMSLVYIRGYAGWMMDIHLERERLEELIDILHQTASDAVDRYAEVGCDSVIAWEDWGLQDRLMIHPDTWRELFRDKMKELIDHVHGRGMKYILHSCGYIADIIDDLAAVGVDVLQLDQQRLMGLETLSRWTGKLCFFCPADIQFMSENRDLEAIRRYCRELASSLSTAEGGFMYKAYAQPLSVHISWEALREEYLAFRNLKTGWHDL